MNNLQNLIITNICYTELVYDRIRKKLNLNLPNNDDIESFVKDIIVNSNKIEQVGKNYYVFSNKEHTRITVNKNNFRVITADKILDKNKRKTYTSRKDLNSRETLAYEYMLDGLSLKRIAKSTGYQWKTLKCFKSLWFDEKGNSRLEKF